MAKQMSKPKNANHSSRTFFYWVIGLVVICIIGLILLSKLTGKNDAEFDFNYKNQPYLGKSDAPVNIVEFGDYKCPVCKNFTENVYPATIKKLVDNGKVKFYFMNYPFINKDSTTAALFSEAVYGELGNDVFWKFHDLLYKKQPEDEKYERIDLYTDSFLQNTLREIVNEDDVKKVESAVKENRYKGALDKDTSYVKKLKINSTPTFFINGKEFNGKTYEDLIKMINDAAKGK
ncbi:thiol-disulfide oxidoreductase [Heyndrickxia shackletonii]|uniref:Thiol-disulfide oxidoreductase n=1 Tax=Heyndrickxia shackletonii TaxID=157838 RepID=A0A0Q3WQN7_9BACI|nr:thioredoxin domain-containing protein [Heyndrickxia shackletonii]KQL53219.1 thiol-disulfide oxidoreductase [Heyndrickxia shackletonii]NEZ00585.1 thioredoxin domain-containing protein [Heyndrickxia shackletonii]